MAENQWGSCLYRSQRAMLDAIAYEWLVDGAVDDATRKILAKETDEHLTEECVSNWQLNMPEDSWPDEDQKPSHMEEQDYTEADLCEAFARLRKGIADGEIE
jgi:hypothetical protein